jgi:hypothetical protein
LTWRRCLRWALMIESFGSMGNLQSEQNAQSSSTAFCSQGKIRSQAGLYSYLTSSRSGSGSSSEIESEIRKIIFRTLSCFVLFSWKMLTTEFYYCIHLQKKSNAYVIND